MKTFINKYVKILSPCHASCEKGRPITFTEYICACTMYCKKMGVYSCYTFQVTCLMATGDARLCNRSDHSWVWQLVAGGNIHPTNKMHSPNRTTFTLWVYAAPPTRGMHLQPCFMQISLGTGNELKYKMINDVYITSIWCLEVFVNRLSK